MDISDVRHFQLITLHWSLHRTTTWWLQPASCWCCILLRLAKGGLHAKQNLTLSWSWWNYDSVVLRRDLKHTGSSSRICSARLTNLPRITHNMTLLGWLIRQTILSFKQSCAAFSRRGMISDCVLSLSHCLLVQIFCHMTIKALTTPVPPYFRISPGMLSIPGDIPFFSMHVTLSTSSLSIGASHASLFSILSSFFKILTSVFNLQLYSSMQYSVQRLWIAFSSVKCLPFIFSIKFVFRLLLLI